MQHVIKTILIFAGITLLSCVSSKKLKESEAELNTATARNAELEANATNLRAHNQELTTSYESLKKEYELSRVECEKTSAELSALTEILDEEQKNLNAVQQKLETALMKFWENDVDVYYKNGLLFVSLTDELLFKSGSAVLGEDGKKALKSLSVVLNEYPKLKVIVVGNTDDRKYMGGSNNWSLSTERANGVVSILANSYKVDAARLTAAGKGKFNPVASNETEEGRAKNRRIDIVLNPDMERIWNSVEYDEAKASE